MRAETDLKTFFFHIKMNRYCHRQSNDNAFIIYRKILKSIPSCKHQPSNIYVCVSYFVSRSVCLIDCSLTLDADGWKFLIFLQGKSQGQLHMNASGNVKITLIAMRFAYVFNTQEANASLPFTSTAAVLSDWRLQWLLLGIPG